MARTVFTVGHGTLAADELVALLEGPEVEQILDVRAFPGSRHNPHFGRDAMAEWLPAKGIGYGWLPALGGRRKPVEGSIHQALRNDSFRAYADHMETEEFLGGIDDLLAREDEGKPAVMCSESVWWRCHRRLIADHLVLVRSVEVLHLMHDGRVTAHPPTEGVRLVDGGLRYDVGVTPPLPDV